MSIVLFGALSLVPATNVKAQVELSWQVRAATRTVHRIRRRPKNSACCRLLTKAVWKLPREHLYGPFWITGNSLQTTSLWRRLVVQQMSGRSDDRHTLTPLGRLAARPSPRFL